MLPRSIYNEEQLLFKQSVKEMVDKIIVPNNAQWEKDQQVSRASWLEMGEAGLLCLQVPQEYGGMGLTDFRYNAIVSEEIALSGCAGPAISYPLHSDIVTPYILDFGSPYLKEKYLPKMVTGEYISAVAMTEPGAGSDLQGMRATAVDKGDYYLVNGSKTFITNGYIADIYVVALKTDASLGAKGISLFLMESTMPGFTKGKPFEKAGLHAQDTCELFFEDVKVPKENLIGELGKGAIGAAESVLAVTVQYCKDRIAFGKPIADLQNTRFKLAEMATKVSVGRAYADRCVELHTEKKLDSAMASAAKLYLSEIQCEVADECVQLHGGYGYIWEYQAARAWADARVQRIYAGTNEIMKELIARSVLK